MADHDKCFIPKHGLVIPKEAWHAKIPPLAKILYAIMNCLTSFDIDGCYASREYYANSIGCSKQRVTQLVKILINAELIFHNGYHANESGRTQLLKRVDLETVNRKSLSNLDGGSNNILLDGSNNNIGGSNNILLDGSNNNLTPNTISNNIKEKEPSFSVSSKYPDSWLKPNYSAKFNFIHSRYPKIDSVHLRYVIDWQEKKIEKFFSFFKSDSNSKLIKQVVNSCDTIDKLIRIDKHYFRETIVPALKWASQDKFWSKKTLSIANIRGAGANDQNHFWHLHQQWCEAEEIDPRKGRYVLESEVIRTPMVNPKWTEYVNAKRKEQGIETDDPPEGLSQEGFEEFFKQKGTVTI